jgi:hypothetical protein
LDLPREYEKCAEILAQRLELDKIDITVAFELTNGMTVGFDGDRGYIRCNKVNRFARLLGILAFRYTGTPFEESETPYFDTVSCMLDLSFSSPLTVESIKEYIDYMALFGFTEIQLYMEDMYELEGRPYFGYMRGRYTYSELREIDDYAYDLGIEAVPCMQTLGHMSNYLRWRESTDVKDTAGVLLVDNDATYEFIEKMLLTASAPFRSNKIHVGCDETYGLGRGKYLDSHEKHDTVDLYLTHVERVAELCKKHGLEPMMWSDMLCSSFSGGRGNFHPSIEIPAYVGERLPENMKLVFWHYGQIKACESDLVPKHRALGKDPIVAGASHTWQSILPDYYFSLMANASTINECKRLGTREIMMTVWNYRHTVYQVSLLDLCQYGELSYRDETDALRARFEFITGASYDAFMRMSDFAFMYKNEDEANKYVYGRGETGHVYFMTDLFLNVKENDWLADTRVEFYASAAEYFKSISAEDGKWQYLYRLAYHLFNMMRIKSLIAENISPAYKANDRAALLTVADEYLPEYLSALELLSDEHGLMRDTYLRPFGTERLDAAYGKMKERARTVRRRIKAYLDGSIETIEELEEKKLAYQWGIIP